VGIGWVDDLTARLPRHGVAREWTMMAWWWLSDVAKYLERGSLFEAAERIALVRQEALKLYAAARDVPYPLFGLTSLLDYEPFEVPQNLAGTYPVPTDRISVAAAARCVAALLAQCSHSAATHLGYDLSTPWETTARQHLETAIHSRHGRPFNRPGAVPGTPDRG